MHSKYLYLFNQILNKVCMGVIELGEILNWNYSTTNYGKSVSLCSDNSAYYN